MGYVIYEYIRLCVCRTNYRPYVNNYVINNNNNNNHRGLDFMPLKITRNTQPSSKMNLKLCRKKKKQGKHKKKKEKNLFNSRFELKFRSL